MPIAAYAAWSCDASTHKTAASGGIASTLYRLAVDNGTPFAGAASDLNFEVHFRTGRTLGDADAYRNSKYTFSDLGTVPDDMRDALMAGEDYLFVGLPCQVAAIKNYACMFKREGRLFTVDLVCHGLPAPAYFKQHMEGLQKRLGSKIQSYYFRDPKFGTKNHMISAYDSLYKLLYKKTPNEDDVYHFAYHHSLIYRDNCYRCIYARPERVGDLTLSDYNGLGLESAYEHSRSEVSCVLVNTQVGRDLWERLLASGAVVAYERPVKEPIKHTRQMNAPSQVPSVRSRFLSLYSEGKDFDSAASEAFGVLMRRERLERMFPVRALAAKVGRVATRVMNKVKLRVPSSSRTLQEDSARPSLETRGENKSGRETVGVLTFHRSDSYGACLQAYATVSFLNEAGYDAEFVDYTNAFEQRGHSFLHSDNGHASGYASALVKDMFFGKARHARQSFSGFVDQCPLSERRYSTHEELERASYDVLVVGSDQVWNRNITTGPDTAFLLLHGRAERRISIASSLGSVELNDGEKDLFRRAFAAFDAISVREEFAREQLAPLTDRPIKLLMDPIFLFDGEHWLQTLGAKSRYRVQHGEKYILTFFLAPDETYRPRVKALAERLGLPVWSIQSIAVRRVDSDRIILGATVADFVTLIAGAELVLTDSFHGAAFSINLGKDFVAFKNKGNPVRVTTLLETLGLQERLDMSASDFTSVDYRDVNSGLEPLREDSRTWVLDAVEGGPNE